MKKRIIWICALVIFSIIFVFCGIMVLRDHLRSKHEKDAYEQLSAQVQQVKKENNKQTQYAPSGILLQYDSLWQQNHHLAGWLSIDMSRINYPVMHTPDDPEYYLRRAFDQSDALSGSLFIDAACQPQSNHVIIYGHNMNDQSMFGNLLLYETEPYARDHSVIHFDTLFEEGEYQVMGAFFCQDSGDQETGDFLFYHYPDLSDFKRFEEYVANVKKASLYDTDVTAEYGDKLLTLSTCSYQTDNGRFVVVAVRKNHN